MPALDINFDDVPDTIVPINTGNYDCEILEAPVQDVKDDPSHPGSNAGKKKVVVKLKITGPDGHQDVGREISDHISVAMKTKLKNLYHSATGNRPGAGGYDPIELIGKVCKAYIARSSYKDQNGKMRETARVEEYLIPQS